MTGQYTPGQGFTQDPRLALARALMGQGASIAPVSSPLEGLARALQGPIGGMTASGVREGRQTGLNAAIAALSDPSIPVADRPAKAFAIFQNASPYDANPFEGSMVAALMPKKGESPLGKIYDDMQRLPEDHPARKLFDLAMRKDAGDPAFVQENSRAQTMGTKTAELEMNPQIIRAETGPKAALAGAEAGARTAVELKAAGPLAQAREEGGLRGKLTPTKPTDGTQPVPLIQAVKAAEAAAGTPGQTQSIAGKMRDDFNQLPPVKNYRETIPIITSMREAATRDNKAADLNLVYGLAKLFDPTSVVREGEQIMVRNTASLPDWLMGHINAVNGGAGLLPETRKNIMEEASSRVSAYKTAHDQYAGQFTEMAKRAGVNPEDVILKTPELPAAAAEIPTADYAEGSLLTGPKGEQKVLRGGKWVDLK